MDSNPNGVRARLYRVKLGLDCGGPGFAKSASVGRNRYCAVLNNVRCNARCLLHPTAYTVRVEDFQQVQMR